jgi:hypothetical protein
MILAGSDLRHISQIILCNIITMGNAPSLDRHFIAAVLDLISTRFSFEEDKSLDSKWQNIHGRRPQPDIIASHFDP